LCIALSIGSHAVARDHQRRGALDGDSVPDMDAVAAEGDRYLAHGSPRSRQALCLLDFYGRSRRVRANDLSVTVKLVVLLGQYMQDNYQGRYYAKAQNLARVQRAAYDEPLKDVDLLLMPTLP
jgi:Asp-tRNA(Asn)/Glu-tRNA(Gln) amidotransferase A subunit family amidase